VASHLAQVPEATSVKDVGAGRTSKLLIDEFLPPQQHDHHARTAIQRS
jgi:hypothetical protein